MLLVKKYQIFPYLDLVKIRVEKMLNNVLEKKETVSYYIKKNFKVLKIAFYYLFSSSIRVEIRFNNVLQSPKKSLFSKWVTHALSQKMPNFFFILIWSK